jgi:CRP/FNR family cyclic AMP-dependent transcriptional regulator
MTARLDFLSQVPLFAELSAVELYALADDMLRRQFTPGETIFQRGDAGQMLYLIESGQVRIYVQDEEGQETSVTFCSKGDVFKALGSFKRQGLVLVKQGHIIIGDAEALRELGS